MFQHYRLRSTHANCRDEHKKAYLSENQFNQQKTIQINGKKITLSKSYQRL